VPLWLDKPEAWHEILPGVFRRIVSSSPAAMMVLYRIEPDHVFPRHSHPHIQLGVLLEGSGVFEVGGKTWSLHPGASYFIPPNVPHELRTDANHRTVIVDVFVPDREDLRSEALPPDES
jgi:quercetin dioxygenase-like cupin family protein